MTKKALFTSKVDKNFVKYEIICNKNNDCHCIKSAVIKVHGVKKSRKVVVVKNKYPVASDER